MIGADDLNHPGVQIISHPLTILNVAQRRGAFQRCAGRIKIIVCEHQIMRARFTALCARRCLNSFWRADVYDMQ